MGTNNNLYTTKVMDGPVQNITVQKYLPYGQPGTLADGTTTDLGTRSFSIVVPAISHSSHIITSMTYYDPEQNYYDPERY